MDHRDSLAFAVECDEWRYCAHTCYFSVAVDWSAPDSQRSKFTSFPLTVHCFDDSDSPQDASQRRSEQLFRDLFAHIDGNILSQRDRGAPVRSNSSNSNNGNAGTAAAISSAVPVDDHSLAYSEVEFRSFRALLRQAGAVDGQVFYDLGCGAGKAVAAAALSGVRFVKCVGIEVLPTLALCASEVAKCLRETAGGGQTTAQEKYKDHKLGPPASPLSLPLLEIRGDNFLDSDWSDADLVFAASLCFSDRLLQALADRGAKLRPGAVLLTLKLPERYEPLYTLGKTVRSVKMSWGRANVYVLVRSASTAGSKHAAAMQMK